MMLRRFAGGFRRKRAWLIPCLQKFNGNMPVERVLLRLIVLATIGVRPHHVRLIRGDYMTCTATYGSGAVIGLVAVAGTAFFAAAVGTTLRSSAGLPLAAGTRPGTGTTTSGFGLCSLFRPWTFNPLLFYPFTLYRGAGAEPLLSPATCRGVLCGLNGIEPTDRSVG